MSVLTSFNPPGAVISLFDGIIASVITEIFIADFALIDASMVRTKSTRDIANETISSSYMAFY